VVETSQGDAVVANAIRVRAENARSLLHCRDAENARAELRRIEPVTTEVLRVHRQVVR
jgi:hypothetical protein